MRQLLFTFIFFLMAMPAFAAPAELTGYELTLRENGMTLRLKINQMVDFKTFTLDNPQRLVVDITDAKWKAPKAEEKIGFVKAVRAGTPQPNTLRVVLDLNQAVIVEDAFMHVPSRVDEPHFLVVQMKPAPEEKKLDIPNDLRRDFSKPAEKKTSSAPTKKEDSKSPAPPSVPVAKPAPKFIPIPQKKPEYFTIVIDAGHGGVDPGAIGALGTKEKNITLRYAQHLRDVLQASGRYKVVMTRDSDKFIPLRGRLKKAQEAQGHLFISLHADTHPEPTMTGLSVYTLSENASDEEAAALAERENKRDIITGVDLSGQSKDVAEVLIDLAQRDTNNTSARFAELVVAELGTEAKLLKNTHRFAGFAVLKGVGIPSALVELGYLSNPIEEKQLIDSNYQDKLVNAIARAIDTYCDQYATQK